MTANNHSERQLATKAPVELAARAGYAANGLMYVAVGLMALQAAVRGGGGAAVDRREALLQILTGPFGQLLLGIIAAGLVGYALGHLLMAARSRAREKKRGLVAAINRLGHATTALIHFSLALAAFELLFTGWLSADNAPDDWTAQLMMVPFGRWLVAAAGLAVIGYALYALYKAYSANFQEAFIQPLAKEQQQQGIIIGKVGYLTRAVVYALIGWFLVRAAWLRDPTQAGGLGDALATLAGQRFGPWLLGAAAVGLITFGLYGIFLARYRDLNL